MTRIPTPPNPDWPLADVTVLTPVARLLDAGLTGDAFERATAATETPWVRNARGVCQLRLGRPAAAVVTLRPLAFDGFTLDRTAPPTFLANYATALLLDGNEDGFESVLGGIPARDHPAVVCLADARRRWRAGLTFWQRAQTLLGLWAPTFVPPEPYGHL